MKNRFSAFIMLLLMLLGMFITSTHIPVATSNPILTVDYENALIKTADRLAALQSADDYGWDWIVTGLTSHSPNPSAPNIYGVTALELLGAYKLTSDTKYFDAAKAAADYLVSLGSDRYHYQFDLEFLVEFAEISGDTTYYTFASNVWTWIKANRPEFADGVTLYNWYYTTRYPGSHGGAVWGTGDWAIAALELGDTAWATDMANVIADNYTRIVLGTDPYGFEYVGWGKALKTFQAVDPTAYATEIADIVSKLTPLQQADGSFTGWVQDEAYVIMGLVSVGEIEMADKAAVWLVENQGYDTIVGGWKLPDGNEYSEVTSEAGQAIFRVIQAIGTVDLDHYSDGIIDVKTMTISQAIKTAYAGDTIVVHDGTYNEALYISKSITIRGSSTPVIKGNGTFTTNYMGAPFTREAVIFVVNASNVILENLDIEGEGLGPGYNNGVVYVYSGGEIRNCIVSPNTIGNMYSLAIEARASDLKVIETTIKNFGRIGVYFANCTGGVYSNTIIGQVYSGANQVNYGIEVEPHQGVRGTIEIIGNEIYNSDNTYLPEPTWSSAGILIDGWKEYMDTPSSTVVIQYNNIHDNYHGIEAAANMLSYAHYNNIYNNREYGVVSAPDYLGNNATFDARYNWWGDPSGPYHPALNPTGKGDNVSDNVNFDHWLLEEYPPPLLSPVLYVDPAEVEYWTLAYGETFEVSVKIEEVTNLAGYEFKLYWDTNLLDLVGVEITPPWPEGNYIVAKNYTDESAGLYWLGVGSYMIGPFSGDTTLAKLTFQITFDPVYPENATCVLDLADTKLSAPAGEKIYHIAHDGKYTIYSTKPKVEVKPSTYTAHKYEEIFTVDIYVSDIVDLYNYTFKLHYDTTLLDAINLEIGPFLKPPIYVYKFIIDDANGEVWLWVWSTSGTPVSGSGVLATITFKVTKATTWTKYHPNILECALDLYDTKLVTDKGVEVPHDVTDGTYRYEPKPGDLDCNGQVNLVDLRIVAYYYDPAYDPIADLNEDGVVDIYDLQIVAYHYGGDC